MAGDVSARWNTLLPSLLRIADKLEVLGFEYVDGVVIAVELLQKQSND